MADTNRTRSAVIDHNNENNEVMLYAITVVPSKNGNVKSTRASFKAGETVYLDVTPKSGYLLKKGTLKYNGITIDSTPHMFIMPNASVSVEAEFISYEEILMGHINDINRKATDRESWKFGIQNIKTRG